MNAASELELIGSILVRILPRRQNGAICTLSNEETMSSKNEPKNETKNSITNFAHVDVLAAAYVRVEARKKELAAAEQDYAEALAKVPVGTTVRIENLPYEVQERNSENGPVRWLSCMVSKRAQAMLRGEAPPPRKTRQKRTTQPEKQSSESA